MQFDILTIFPHLFDSFLNESLIKKSSQKGLNKFCVHDLRDYSNNKHLTVDPVKSFKKKFNRVDDRPYGGGAGMVLMAGPILATLKHPSAPLRAGLNTKTLKHLNTETQKTLSRSAQNKQKHKSVKTKVVLLSPTGKQFNQKTARRFSKLGQLILICGRYEGVDVRVEKFIDEKISIGPYILSGGELAAMIIIESVARLIPEYLSNPNSLKQESFNKNFLEYPQYTRPEILEVNGRRLSVPKVLLSGNHKKIEEWRQQHTITLEH